MKESSPTAINTESPMLQSLVIYHKVLTTALTLITLLEVHTSLHYTFFLLSYTTLLCQCENYFMELKI